MRRSFAEYQAELNEHHPLIKDLILDLTEACWIIHNRRERSAEVDQKDAEDTADHFLMEGHYGPHQDSNQRARISANHR